MYQPLTSDGAANGAPTNRKKNLLTAVFATVGVVAMVAAVVFVVTSNGDGEDRVFTGAMDASLSSSNDVLQEPIVLTSDLLGDVWTSCGQDSDHIHIDTVTITPDPPTKGASVQVDFTGSLDKDVSSGSIAADLTVDFIPIKKTLDLCSTIKGFKQCPVAKGPLSASVKEDIPAWLPGHIKGTVKATDQDGEELACIKLDLALKKKIAEANVNEAGSSHSCASDNDCATDEYCFMNLYCHKILRAHEPVNSDDIVDMVNNDPSSTWTAEASAYFDQFDLSEASGLMGTHIGNLPPRKTFDDETLAATPSSFDSRDQWKGCIGGILDQAKCGSCWAFGAAEAISDRMCIEGVTSSFLQLAPLDLVACDNGFFNDGCQGGQLTAAWDYAKSSGLVTEACAPYLESEGGPIPTCDPTSEPCLDFVDTPSCTKKCSNGASWTGDKHFLKSVYSVSGEEDMMAEISKNGPIEAAFTVYQDFVHYKSGVYAHTTGSALGGHAIKIIGYGEENGTKYWLVQNSWTTTWGDGGYFKIQRGNDECGIESGAVGGSFQ